MGRRRHRPVPPPPRVDLTGPITGEMSARELLPGWYEVGYLGDLADPELNALLPAVSVVWARKLWDERPGAYAYIPLGWRDLLRGVDRVMMTAHDGKPPVGVHSSLLVLARMVRRYGIVPLRVVASGGSSAILALWNADPWLW